MRVFNPRIVYKTITLNDEKCRDIANGAALVRYGQTCLATGVITIFKYKLADTVTLGNDIAVKIRQELANIDAKEPEIIAHEMHHLHNWSIELCRVSQTLYEYMELLYTDELTALAAGRLHTKPYPEPEDVASELYAASEYYMGCAYLNTYMHEFDYVTDEIIARGGRNELAEQNKLYQTAPNLLNSPYHNQVLKHFFTYDTCMLSSMNLYRMRHTKDWGLFKQNVNTIKQEHLSALFKLIQTKLGRTK